MMLLLLAAIAIAAGLCVGGDMKCEAEGTDALELGGRVGCCW
jgi:hypothetical protein